MKMNGKVINTLIDSGLEAKGLAKSMSVKILPCNQSVLKTS